MSEYGSPSLITCPRCSARGEPDGFFHSALGLVCEACHRREKVEDSLRTSTNSGNVDAMMSALLSAALGFGSLLFLVLSLGRPIPIRALAIFLFAVFASVGGWIRTRRLARQRHWTVIASIGALVALLSLVLLVVQFF